MFDDQTLPAQVLKNPAMVQNMALSEFEARLGGVYSVADANNTFNLALEASSSMNAQSVRYMERQFEAQYPPRAVTSADLYNHMSDFDYLMLVAAPSSTVLKLTFDLNYLISQAQSFSTIYNRVTIPVSTAFFVGPLTFGIYYPINIDINKITNNVNVLWDTTTPNALQTLSTNMVDFVQWSTGGLNLITLMIPVSQFSVSSTIYPVVVQQGFVQTISYTDQFYAARVFTNLPSGGWTELSYTLSETAYDPTKPTAKINIQADTNSVGISIPQIYFTNGQIGNQVRVMLYTTKGALTLDLTSVEIANCNCNFDLTAPNTSIYSAILANLATIDLTPAATVITGGSSALSFAELRNLIVNGGLYTNVPVTPAELTAFAAKQGFSISKYLDNVTNRIYYASNTIQGGQNGFVMVTTGTVSVQPATMTGVSSILNFVSDNAVTILPTTVYKFDPASNICTPLSDTQLSALKGMSKANFATEVNARTYTQCPFHIVTYTDSQYPVTKSFNLMNPAVPNIRFIADNVFLTPQMSVTSAVVLHNANGTGGYTIRLGVIKTPAMTQIAESDIALYLSTIDANGDRVYGIATLTGTVSGISVYELNIPTTYYISQTNTFRSTMTVVGSATATVDINLASTFTVTALITASLFPDVAQDVNLINTIAAPYDQMLGVSQQQLDVVFGVDLSDQVYNITTANWSSEVYAAYPETVYQTYAQDVYLKNAQGGIVFTASNGQIQITKLHSAGDFQLDALGNKIIKHAQNSVMLDPFNNPIPTGERALQYTVRSMMFDIRLFYSQNQADLAFIQNLTSTLSSYFATIAELRTNLLEQTQLFYVPNSTMGTATFSAGNNTPLQLDLGFSFSLVVYVSQATLGNQILQASILADITAIIQQEMLLPVISLTEIADNIRAALADSIVAVDVDGIDGTQSLQTVIVPPGTTTPIVGQQLIYDVNSDALALQQAITLKFVLAA